MNIIRLLFELFLIYILYKFIFDFVVPVYRTSKQMKGKMQEMQNRMRQQQEQFNRSSEENRKTYKAEPRSASKAGDYIDYEEVRD